MSIIGEAALSAFFEGLFDKLASSDLLKIFEQEKLHADLKKWRTTLLKIRAVLDDAEEKQMTSRLAKIWLVELEDLAHDADDILDEFATEVLRRKLNAEPRTSKVRKFIPACCVGFNPSSVMFNANMRSKIEDIDTRLQNIVTDMNGLGLIESTGRRTRTTRSWVPTTSLVNEGHVYGRDEDKKALIDLLLSHELSDAQLSVIPIVGIGGLGKTTLVQLVYNDNDVSCYFDLKAWVCVSDDFDIVRVTKVILQSIIAPKTCSDNDLNLLQVQLKEKLFGKKFLLILDDVWNEDYNNWTKLRIPFEFGAPGSKIIVTTRNQGVSSTMGTTSTYELKILSNDACWRVFSQHALGATNFTMHPELEEIGREILHRCKGSPLAAKVLGGLLRTKRNSDEWKNVLNSKIWEIPEEKSTILSILKLSYQHLPSHLKRCFAYCSLFPKDYAFEEKELILLWMAEGLVQETEGNKPMEVVASEYFRDLHMRSFFQQSSNHESLFVMHDLINDIAQWAVGGLCYRLEDTMGGDKQSNISTKVRHFSYIKFEYDGIKRFENFPKDVHLRTFLPLPIKENGYLTNHVPNCLLPRLRYLRVLSLGGYKTTELPNSISDLKHLRYLNLSNTSIRSLPSSTCSLYNLQTLILKGCSSLTNLPEKIGNLVNLRHLDITNVNSIKEMPVGIDELKSLRTLSNFVVGKDTGSKIGDLMNLEFLQGKLCISSLENVVDVEDARKANLNGKKSIDALVMKWENALDDIQNEGIAIDVLNMLQPYRTVKTLFIEGYVGARFPMWLSDPSFSNMVEVRIDRCGKCMSLPAIGQLPSLKYLVIERMAMVQSVGLEFYGEGYLKPFQSLETLRFDDMQEWKDWIPCGVEYEEFPCLRELSISRCPKLQGKLPRNLPSLETLSIHACEKLVVSIPNLPMLEKIEIVGCKEVNRSTIELCLLKSMFVSISDLKILTEEFMPGSAQVETLVIYDCKELRSLWQDRFMSLETLDIISCPSLLNINCLTSRVKALEIDSCNTLKSLPISDCTCLEYATIKNCFSLTFISRGQLPPTLKNLKIQFCENLQFVVDMEGESSSSSSSTPFSLTMSQENLNRNNNNSYGSLLEHLEIIDCPSLKCLCDLPSTLKHLEIMACSELTSLSSRDELPTALKHLSVSFCPKLESVTNKLPASLENLEIGDCKKLKFLPEGIHKLCHLNKIDIWKCSSVVSFPDGGLLPTNLSVLCIATCEKLETLPNLTSLPHLIILECESIKSFPGEGFPTNLTNLTLSGVNTCKKILEWGLHRLTSLTYLCIGGGLPDWQSFPEEEDGKLMMMMPSSLIYLRIEDFPNIVSLSSMGFQNLSALEGLSIFNCPKLAFLPEKGLPPSLLDLCIAECPVLKQHCKKGKGQEWFKIIDIPRVQILSSSDFCS
ncbi:hypothetical protein ACB092_11G249000 [Castanea dentata]